MSVPPSAPPTRRLVLAGALVAGITSLTGCGVRLEDDAPHIPFVPTRDPIPGESALLAVLGTLTDSDEEHAAERADLLREALLDAQVPEDLVTGAAAPAGAGERIPAFEGAVRDCGQGMLPLVGRLVATHRIVTDAAAETGADADTMWTRPDTGPWERAVVAADALQATRAAIYALDLIAAKADSASVTAQVRAASAGLGDIGVRQTTAAGDAVEPVALGYDVPHRLTTEEAQELGRQTFTRLLAAYASGFARLGADRDAALEVVHWMVTAERLSRPRFRLPVPVLYGDDTSSS